MAAAASFAMLFALTAEVARGQDIEWTRQFGTSVNDGAAAIFVHATGVYVAGGTAGTLPGQTSAGNSDAFVRKYDADGTEVWTRQFGTSGVDFTAAISVDATGVYVAGSTAGTFPGQTSAGDFDAFVRKYDADGTEVWTRQFGSSSFDTPFGISVDATGVYVAGRTASTLPGQTSVGFVDAFVRKYDAAGTEVWTRQFGTSVNDEALAIFVDTTGVYVAGQTDGTFPGQTSAGNSDAFVRKYDAAGTEVWTRQFGTSVNDSAHAISVDATGVYVAGRTPGVFPGQTSAGGEDAFVRKYDAAGTEVWTRQFGTSGFDQVLGTSVDATGVYVAGQTGGALAGQTSAGDLDAFVRKYDAAGTELWTRQFGTPGGDLAIEISVDATGVYVAGQTPGVLPGQTSAGGEDAFVVKIGPPMISVEMDIKPGSFPNSINPRNRGTIPVAILTTDSFDATTVDSTTVLFGPTGTEAAPVHAALEDVDGDGDTDLILDFKTQATGIQCGDTFASLSGETFSGQLIQGSDSIRTVGCK